MYKILVTTTYSITGGTSSVHTVVVDFDSKEAAEVAIAAITRGTTSFNISQTAIALYA